MTDNCSLVAEPDMSPNRVSCPSTPISAEPVAREKACQRTTPSKSKDNHNHTNDDLSETPPDKKSSIKAVSTACSRSLSVTSFSKKPARSIPSLTRPVRSTNSNGNNNNSNNSNLPTPFKAFANRAVSECSALSSSPATRFQAVRAANQPTTVILPAATSNSSSQPTTRTHISSPSSSSSSRQLQQPFSHFIKTSTSASEVSSAQLLSDKQPLCQLATTTYSTDTDIDNSISEPASPAVSADTKSAPEMSIDDDDPTKNDILSSLLIPNSCSGLTSLNGVAKDSSTNSSENNSINNNDTSKLSTTNAFSQQQPLADSNLKPKSNLLPSLATENQIDVEMSQSDDNSSPAKSHSKNLSTNSLITKAQPTATTADQSFTDFNRSKTIVNFEQESNGGTSVMSTNVVSMEENTLGLFESENFTHSQETNANTQDNTRKNEDDKNTSNEDSSKDSDTATQANVKTKFVLQSTTSTEPNKQEKALKPRKVKGIIKNAAYTHFDTRKNLGRRKTVRFDSSLLDSRVFHEDCFDDNDDNSDDDPDYVDEDDEEEGSHEIRSVKKGSLMAQFERDFGSDSDSEEENEESEQEEKEKDQQQAEKEKSQADEDFELSPDVFDSEMCDPDPTLIPNSDGTILEQEGVDKEALDQIDTDKSNGFGERENNEEEEDDSDSPRPFIFPVFDFQRNRDGEEEEEEEDSETEEGHAGNLDYDEFDLDYEDEDTQFDYDSDFFDDHTREELAYMRRDMLDYPDGDIAHSNKLLNKKIDETSLPPLQSHHHIRSAIQVNYFKNVIVDTIEDMKLHMEMEKVNQDNNNTADGNNNKRKRSPYKPFTLSRPKKLYLDHNCDKMLESYARSMAGDFFKWVAQAQAINGGGNSNGEEWKNSVKQFEQRKAKEEGKKGQVLENSVGEDEMNELAPNFSAQAQDSIENNDTNTENKATNGDAKDGTEESVKCKSSDESMETSSQDQILVEMTVVSATNLDSTIGNEASEIISTSQESKPDETGSSAEHSISPKDKDSIESETVTNQPQTDSSNDETGTEPEKLYIDPFTVSTAAEILCQDLTRLYNEESLSTPWITKTAFSRIISSIQRNSFEKSESQSQSHLDNDAVFGSTLPPLYNETRTHEDSNIYSLLPNGTNYGMQQQYQQIPPYINSQQPHSGQYGMSSSGVPGSVIYGNVTSFPVLPPQSHSFVPGAVNGEGERGGSSTSNFIVVDYEHPTTAPPTDALSNFSNLASMHSATQLSKRKRLRSADNLYREHQLKNLTHIQDFDKEENGSESNVEARSADSYEATISSSSQELNADGEYDTNNNDSDNINNNTSLQPPALKRRCLRPSNSLNRNFVNNCQAGNFATADNKAIDTTNDKIDEKSGIPLMSALPSLSFGPPLATSSFIEQPSDENKNDEGNGTEGEENQDVNGDKSEKPKASTIEPETLES